MDEPVKISLDTQENSQNFAFLREEGLNVIRRLAPDTWTDHNLHDPGITLLEALSYAITETGLTGSLDMIDLLTSSEKQAPQEFFTAAKVLPSSPVSIQDFQKVLIDHPLVKKAWMSALYGEPLGRWSALLEFQKEELNSNVVEGKVNVSGTDYDIDIALPHWDDPEVLPLQQDVLVQTLKFLNPIDPWQLIEGGDAYFTRIHVDYQPQGGGTTFFEAWVVIQITTPVSDPVTALPLILQQVSILIQITGDNSDADQTILKQYNRRVTEAFENSRIIRRYLKTYRNLCEIFGEFIAVRIQEVAIVANIEVSPNANTESLAADIFYAVDKYIAPDFNSSSLNHLQEAGVETSTIFDGPLLHYGFIPETILGTERSTNKLFTSDIIRLILQLRKPGATDIQTREDITSRSIIAVRNLSLSLYIDNRIITADAKDCLQLINSIRYIPRLNPAKCQVTFIRNNVEVIYNEARTIKLFEQKKLIENILPDAGTPDIPILKGVTYPVGDYYPVQNSLPLTYGVGPNGLPLSASQQRRAQAKQLKGYLFFYEQILANHFAQLANMNTFFSASNDVKTTLFQQSLYSLPDVADLFAGFDASAESFADFIADANNTYRTTLTTGLENENQFLDRRNRMLDHLLARLSESMDELSALAYRESYNIPNASSLNLVQLQTLQAQRRIATAYRLLKEKSDFYYDLPLLHQNRLQSFGNLSAKKKTLVVTQPINAGYGWEIRIDNNTPVFQQSNLETTDTAARLRAEEALILATSTNYYSAVAIGGQFRLELKAGDSVEPSGQTIQTFNTLIAANNAIALIRKNILHSWAKYNLSALEAKLYHLLEIETKGDRRQLVTPIDDYFEVFNDTISTKKFRLWEQTSHSGDILLQSETNYPNEVDARVAIDVTIRQGIFPENYTTGLPFSGPFAVTLKDIAGSIIAGSPGTFSTTGEAKQQAETIRQHLYRYYSMEGFYIIEHILLNPVAITDTPLQIADSENPCQPVLTTRKDSYSFQLTFVFPSGYKQNFNTAAPVRQPGQPDRFRDEEYRTYAEATIRKTCPGHIFPVIIWVDRAMPGLALPPDTPSFDNFENAYRQWIAAYFTDEISETDLAPLRNALVNILNNMYMATG